MVVFKTCLFYDLNSRIFILPVYIVTGRKQTLVDTIGIIKFGILSALRMRGLHDKRHLLAKMRICGSENYPATFLKNLCLLSRIFILITQFYKCKSSREMLQVQLKAV